MDHLAGTYVGPNTTKFENSYAKNPFGWKLESVAPDVTGFFPHVVIQSRLLRSRDLRFFL